MQRDNNLTSNTGCEKSGDKPLSETISNAHSAGDGALRLSEDGLIEPTGETIADAEANREAETKKDEY